MKVRVNWDTDGISAKELGLPEVVDMPTLNGENIANYLSDEYEYCVESFKIKELDSGYWHGDYAWVLSDENGEMIILVGGYTLEEAIEAKEAIDSEAIDDDWDCKFDEFIHWADSEEWIEQQDLSGEWAEMYEERKI